MNRLLILLLIFLCLQTGYAQDNATQSPNRTPEEVQQWLNERLKKAKVKTLQPYDHPDFFKRDTVKVVGYIKGYDSKTVFTSGIIFHRNEITGEDAPATIRVYEDGRFEGEIVAVHPLETEIVFGRRHVVFYAEPGHTIGIVLDAKDFVPTASTRKDSRFFEHTEYLGPGATISKELSEWRVEAPRLGDSYKTVQPDSFKKQQMSRWLAERERVDNLLNQRNVDPRTKIIRINDVDLSFAGILLDYNQARMFASRRDSFEMPADYFNFLDNVPLNDKTLVINSGFSTFINLLEIPVQLASDFYSDFQGLDSATLNLYNLSEIPLLIDIVKLRSFKLILAAAPDGMDLAASKAIAKNNVKSPFLRDEADRLFSFYEQNNHGYELPDTEAAKVFKNIIDKYKGKVLIVDFWAQWCAPCREGIEKTVELRTKHQNHPDLDFVFITDVEGTRADFFNRYGEENFMRNSYRVSADEYQSLQELFKFNGIPRYILVDDSGRIRNDNFPLGNLKHELYKMFPKKFMRNSL